MSYLITNPKTSFKNRRRAEKLWSKSTHPVPAAAGVVAWGGAVQQLVGPSHIIISGILATIGTVALSTSGWYYTRFSRKQQMKFVPYTGGQHQELKEWSQMLESIFAIEEELFNYVESLDEDNFARPAAVDAWKAVSEVQWDALMLYNKMTPYLMNVRPTTRQILEDEQHKISLWRDNVELISNNVLHLGIRSETFVTTADKSHLEILAKELSVMCASLDDLAHTSSRQLGEASDLDEFHEEYAADGSHRVRGV